MLRHIGMRNIGIPGKRHQGMCVLPVRGVPFVRKCGKFHGFAKVGSSDL